MKKIFDDGMKSLKTGGKLVVGAILVASSTMVFSVLAAPPGTPYNLGETLQPGCAPGDANCTVVTPAASGANSDITSLSGLTTALSVPQGGTGLSTIASGSLLYASALDTLSELGLEPLLSIVAGDLTLDSTIMVEGENVSLLTNDANYVALGDNVSGLTNDANYVALGDNVSGLTNDANYVALGDNVSGLTNDANYVALGDNVSGLTNDANYVAVGDNVSDLVNDAGYLTSYTETDPVFGASAVQTWWTGGGDLSVLDNTTSLFVAAGDNVSDLVNDAGYLTSYTETDPNLTTWLATPTLTHPLNMSSNNIYNVTDITSTTANLAMMRLVSRAAPIPGPYFAGDMYEDSTANELCYYDGSGWLNIMTGVTGGCGV